jgi:hypothetical protein
MPRVAEAAGAERLDRRPDTPGQAGPQAANADRHARLDALLRQRLASLLPGLAATQRKYRLRLVGALVAAVLVVVLSFAFEADALIPLGFMGLLVALVALPHFARVFRDQVRGALTPLVCEAIGGISHRVGGAPAVLQRLERLPLVRPHGHRTIDDVFTGSHDGTAFDMAELRLFNVVTRSSGSGSKRTTTTTEKTVFKGLAFLVSTPRPVPVRVVVRGPVGWFGGRWRLSDKALTAQGYTRVDVPDADFSRHLSLWADDPDQALKVVGPGLAATLARLAATAGRKRIDAAFIAARFVLLLPKGGNAFSVGGLFRSLGRLAPDAHALLDEVMVVHRLIDVLKAPPPPPPSPAPPAPAPAG